jgi:RNA polymerase subunit RPABC4/transcription elongation factor Spt4
LNPVVREPWPKDTELEDPPKRRRIKFAYEDVEKILLSFRFKAHSEAFLDPAVPFEINGEPVEIPELPENPDLLTFVDKEDIDVSNLVKVSKEGEPNIIAVNIHYKKHGWSSTPIGTLHLFFKFILGEKVATPMAEVPRDIKFCMNCGKTIPTSSVYCQFCGLQAPTGGTMFKECRNCQMALPPPARFCKNCGVEQPGQTP